ncbi:MAG: glycosyltransferase family 4 protein [Candidatus Omnitrophica bacterium]|nr:glycosyltransferase family 4 protein [Candidatus Omnitrophota bacterium]
MRLGIDAREIQDGVYTGIGRPLANFLRYFAALDNDDICVLFSSRKIPVDFGPRVVNVVLEEKFTLAWDQWHLPWAIKKMGIDLFYSPYYKIPLIKFCPTVSAILDLMYLIFEPYQKQLSPLARLYYATLGRLYAHRADKIWTCSVYSKRDIQRVYGVHDSKITVVPLSVSGIYRRETNPGHIEAMRQEWNINGRYILYMGNFKAHKNVENIIHAFAALVPMFPDLKLILAGPKEHTYPRLVKSTQDYHLEDKVLFPGKILEHDQPHLLYSGAEVFVMPSLYEGFGLPPAEAMACQTPVVASNTTSIPEVVRDAGLLVDPNDVSQIAAAIKRILQEEGLAKDLVKKGLEYVKEYDEHKTSQQLYDFFKQTLKEHAPTTHI